MTTELRIRRARALLRHALLQLHPEALVGIEAQEVLPDVRAASQHAVARGLSAAGPGPAVEALIGEARAEIQATSQQIQSATDAPAPRSIGDALQRLRLQPRLELAAELALCAHLDPITRQAGVLLAQLLQRGQALGVGVLDDALHLAGLGPGVLTNATEEGGVLDRLGVLELHELIGGDPGARLALPTPRLLSFLNGSDAPGPRLEPFLLQRAFDGPEQQALRTALAGPIEAVRAALAEGHPVLLSGAAHAGGSCVVAAAAESLGRPFFGVRAEALWKEKHVLPTALCHSRLTGAVLLAAGAEALPEAWQQARDGLLRLNDDLGALGAPAVLRFHGKVPPLFAESVGRALGGVEVRLPPLELPARRALFRGCLAAMAPDLGDEVQAPDDDALDALAAEGAGFALGAESIAIACSYATSRARSPEQRERGLTAALLREACAVTVTRRLREYASRVETVSRWDDLVLPEDKLRSVRDIVRYAQHRRQIFEDWGFGRKMSYGRALSCMFSGPSGTGKTMVAGLVARELGVELFRVDLSAVVSKYIGETEERLDALFTEAGQTGVALLFDEADALFAKRTEVQSSNDRYANLEVNFLLQRLEDFDGVVFLTTNFGTSIDEAFLRRLRFRIEFEAPGVEERIRLWETMLPDEMPQSDDLDLDWIGENYELAGGHVRNAVLRAALLAADAGTPLTMALAVQAANAEYRELGKLAPVYRPDEW